MDEETTVATGPGVAQIFDLHALKAFAADQRVRRMLFKTDQAVRRRYLGAHALPEPRGHVRSGAGWPPNVS
jgi:hypothetical protein